MKVMETVNVIINESSDSGSEKFSKEIPKEILPLGPREVQEIVEQEPASSSTLGTPSVVEDSVDISAESFTTLGDAGVLGDADSCLTIS